ncbi:hypothetical protein GGI02_004985 [Coemansia sp. RSA 2322]|nr:hypothetical protein GGI02_004985 [Coemansia sp. RSA 2322]
MGSAHYFGAEQRGSTAGSASTRSSVVRVLGEGSRGPDLPALPDGASEASTRRFSAARPVGSAVKTEAKAAVKAPGAPWSGDEIATLADASVGFWRSGRVVDVAAVGGGLGRTSSDVSAMLEYLLVGYVRFGPTACWGSESRQLVREWAAAQFPRNEHLNAGSSVAAPARRDTWLAALTCRPRTRPRAASVYGVADHHSATSGQNIVADFREGLQAKEAEAPPGLAPAHRRSRSAASMPQAVVPPPVPVPTPVPVPVPAAPVFTGGLRARPAPSTLSRTSRSRRLRSAPGASTTLPRASSTPQASEAPPSSLPVPDVLPSPAFSDAPLDAAFSDLPAETRTGIRRFVTRFMADFPTDFRQRVEAQRAGRSGLCLTVDNYADFRYGDDAFLKAIETVYRTVGGSMVYTCNLFFHVQLLHAIRLDRIAVADDTWLRANEFATRPQPQPSLGMVLQKFEEMREMIQQMQLQKNQ